MPSLLQAEDQDQTGAREITSSGSDRASSVGWPTKSAGLRPAHADNCCELAGAGCSANDTGGYMLGVGYYHTLSRQTQARVMATYIKNDDLQYYTTAGGVGSPLDYGSSIWGVTVDLKHSF